MPAPIDRRGWRRRDALTSTHIPGTPTRDTIEAVRPSELILDDIRHICVRVLARIA